MSPDDLLPDRFQGCLLGLAIGDAIGTTLEFKIKGSFEPITDMIGGGPFGLKPGQWTDDTSMALCLAHSLLYCNGFNPIDQMNRYCNWWRFGYMSSTGECFDIGMTVSTALNKYLKTEDPFSGDINPRSAGNGSLMRLAPVPMYFYPDFQNVLKYSGKSSRTTHATAECIDACRYFSSLLFYIFKGTTKEELITTQTYQPETIKIKEISSGAFISKSRDEIFGTGYVVASLEAALWCFFNTENYSDAVLMAANLGDDADTTAAICGQISGAYYGVSSFPTEWVEKTFQSSDILEVALRMCTSTR